jgi:hypothetical protein
MKKEEIVSFNEKENWGGLVNPRDHDAAYGARFADNRKREFGIFGNRATLVGKKSIAEKLEKFILSKKVIKDIRNNTSFSYYGDKDRNCWSTKYSIGNDIDVLLDVTCSGEYVYVKAYADRAPSCVLDVELVSDKFGEKAFIVKMEGRSGEFPIIHADTKTAAMNTLIDFIANELEGRDDLWPI